MRAFVGIDFSKQLKGEISDLQKELRGFAKSGRWKYIDNFHLTLKFLDEVHHSKINDISREMSKVCSSYEAFKLNISQIGNFSGKGCFRVFWLGLGGELDKLRLLQSGIDDSFLKFGFEKEKREYKPHVTIGQDLSFEIGFEEIKNITEAKTFSEIKVDRVNLFKSEQIGNKRVYTSIGEYLLK